MAFESLNQHTDNLVKQYQRTLNFAYLFALTDFHDTVLQNPKFNSQRRYCLKRIHEINPAYFKGYFKRDQP